MEVLPRTLTGILIYRTTHAVINSGASGIGAGFLRVPSYGQTVTKLKTKVGLLGPLYSLDAGYKGRG